MNKKNASIVSFSVGFRPGAPRAFSLLLITIILVMINPDFLFSQERLIHYLEQKDFLELIKKYAPDSLQFEIKGLQAERLEKRSFDIAPGYRVQVFAGISEENARQVVAQMQQLALDSVYLIKTTENLYKVQLGNFRERQEAEIFLDKLYYAGVKNAWIVETEIHVPRNFTPAVESDTMEWPEMVYSVQLLATNTPGKARELKQQLIRQFQYPVYIIEEQGLWKVVAGAFPEKVQAYRFRDVLVSAGYPDAWVTQMEKNVRNVQ